MCVFSQLLWSIKHHAAYHEEGITHKVHGKREIFGPGLGLTVTPDVTTATLKGLTRTMVLLGNAVPTQEQFPTHPPCPDSPIHYS